MALVMIPTSMWRLKSDRKHQTPLALITRSAWKWSYRCWVMCCHGSWQPLWWNIIYIHVLWSVQARKLEENVLAGWTPTMYYPVSLLLCWCRWWSIASPFNAGCRTSQGLAHWVIIPKCQKLHWSCFIPVGQITVVYARGVNMCEPSQHQRAHSSLKKNNWLCPEIADPDQPKLEDNSDDTTTISWGKNRWSIGQCWFVSW